MKISNGFTLKLFHLALKKYGKCCLKMCGNPVRACVFTGINFGFKVGFALLHKSDENKWSIRKKHW